MRLFLLFVRKLAKSLPFTAFVISIALLSGCVRNQDLRGYTFQLENLEQIKTGSSSRDTVLNVLGSPSTKSTFGDETWYYISSKRSRIAFFQPRTEEQTVVSISFAQDGLVKDIQQYTADDMRNIAFSSDTTPTKGHDLTIVQQLLGNVGRFNPNQKAGRVGNHDSSNIP